jgi:hypothetical protein
LQSKDGERLLVLQLAKWDKRHYRLDFQAPFEAFPAFLFALAYFDLELCQEIVGFIFAS